MKTLIDVLDAAGGIPENSNVLLVGPPGPEKTMLSLRMLKEALKEGGKGIYVTTDVAPSEIEKKSKEYDADLTNFVNKSLWFVDCYSWTLGKPATQRTDIIVPGPSALNDLSIGTAQALRSAADSPRIVFQSLSTLLLYNNPDIVFRFVQITGARLKAAAATTLYHCEASMHDERTLATLKHLMDVTIEIKAEEGKLFLQAPAIGVREWQQFKL